MGTQLNIDRLIDRFVDHINHQPRRRIREADLPAELREGPPEFGLYYHWRIQPFSNISWINTVEALLPLPFPPAYRSLITRYIFPAFVAQPLLLLANTGQNLYNEMSAALLQNKVLSTALLDAGLVQFARPATGEYDPVCFDMRRPGPDGDFPIVRVNHESVLAGNPPDIMSEISSSFQSFLDRRLILEPASLR